MKFKNRFVLFAIIGSLFIISGLITYPNSALGMTVVQPSPLIKITHTTKVVWVGVVNVSDIAKQKQSVYHGGVINPPLQTSSIEAQNWQKLLNSGKVPKGLIPVVPETPIMWTPSLLKIIEKPVAPSHQKYLVEIQNHILVVNREEK